MSYCRSSDDSNVYVFGSGEGWEIHVQASEQIDKTVRFDQDNLDAYWDNWRPFPHEKAGQSILCTTRQECLDKLLGLRASGLMVPDRALDRLRREITAPQRQTQK